MHYKRISVFLNRKVLALGNLFRYIQRRITKYKLEEGIFSAVFICCSDKLSTVLDRFLGKPFVKQRHSLVRGWKVSLIVCT